VRRWLAAGGEVHRLDDAALTRFLFARRRQTGPAGINIELKALRVFYRLMALVGAAPSSLGRKIPANHRTPKRLPRWLTDVQVGTLLSAQDLRTFRGLRDHLVIRMLYETGLRASELAALRCSDVLVDGSVFVDHGKGGVDRYVPISAELMQLLDGYMAQRAARCHGRRSALWLTERGLPLRNGRSVWTIVDRYARPALGLAAGYDRLRVTARRSWSGHYPHLLRASFANALLAGGCPLTAIQQMMGHACLDTTGLYLGTDIAQLRAAVAVHPRFRSGR
jgi:site-specific recombinase XerD